MVRETSTGIEYEFVGKRTGPLGVRWVDLKRVGFTHRISVPERLFAQRFEEVLVG